MKTTKISMRAIVASAVAAAILMAVVLVLPLLGEGRHQLNYVAKSTAVQKALRVVSDGLITKGSVVPFTQREDNDGVAVEILVASDGKVVVLGRSGWLGFIAIPKVTTSGVVWHCHSILDRYPWSVRCGE